MSRTHLVCLPCQIAVKGERWPQREHHCPRCAEPMVDAGPHLAIPPRRDRREWRVLASLLHAGVTFHPRCGCCGDGPGYRPRTPREWREWHHTRAAGDDNP